MATRVLIRKDGHMVVWTPRLALNREFQEGLIDDTGELVKSAPSPKPAVVSGATMVKGRLTPEQLEQMTKREMADRAKELYGAALDVTKSAESLRGQLWKLQEQNKQEDKS